MPVDHYENFPVASLLLPARLRPPIETIYRFARGADDIADEGDASDAERLAGLAAYQAQLDCIASDAEPEDAPFAALARTIRTHDLPIGLFSDLLSAFAQDVTTKRYADFPTLLDYCRRSANPVGRLLLHLFDRATPVNLARSDLICSALQLANFWQDVAIDWQKGRVYLPQEDLLRFGVDEAQIAEGRCDARWTALMDFELNRTEQMLREGAPLARDLPGRIGWEIRFTVQGGLRIVKRVRALRGDVFARRPTLQTRDWLAIVANGLFRHPKAA